MATKKLTKRYNNCSMINADIRDYKLQYGITQVRSSKKKRRPWKQARRRNSCLLWLTWYMLKQVTCFTISLTSESLAHDLESFAGHAKRSIINVEDVKVCSLERNALTSSCVVEGTKDWFVKGTMLANDRGT